MPTVESFLRIFNSRTPLDNTLYQDEKNTLWANRYYSVIRLLRLIYIPYRWVIAYPLFGLSTVFFTTLCTILVFTRGPRIASKYAGTPWARLACHITPALVSVKGRHHLSKEQSYVVVANHQSHYDILIIYGWLGVDFKWVMKHTIRKIPFIGYCCNLLGHIFIDRSDTTTAIRSIENAKTRIKDGTSIFFFPEGTRSDDSQVQPFKKGAFRLALDLGLPILPITLQGTGNVLPKNSAALLPGKIEMTMHPPIDTSSYSTENIKDLIDLTRSIIQGNDR